MSLARFKRLIAKKEGYSLNDIQFVNCKVKLGDDEDITWTVMECYGDQPVRY